MKRAFNKVKSLIQKNSKHRKGTRTQEMNFTYLLSHLQEEVNELRDAPDDPVEMADIIGILIHYAIKQGWTEEFLESLVIEKLNLRFAD